MRRKLRWRWRWGTGVDGGTTSRAWGRCLPAATNSQERLGQFLHLNQLLIAPETPRTIQIQSVLFRVIAANRTVKASGNQVKADGTIKHHFYSVITCKTIRRRLCVRFLTIYLFSFYSVWGVCLFWNHFTYVHSYFIPSISMLIFLLASIVYSPFCSVYCAVLFFLFF